MQKLFLGKGVLISGVSLERGSLVGLLILKLKLISPGAQVKRSMPLTSRLRSASSWGQRSPKNPVVSYVISVN